MSIYKRSLLVFVAAAAMSASVFAGDADFTLVNRTGYSIREVYISPTARSAWGNDRLGDGTLENSRSRLFRFSDRSACKQDLKVVFDDDNSEVVWENVDLCEINKLTIKYDRSSKTVSAESE